MRTRRTPIQDSEVPQKIWQDAHSRILVIGRRALKSVYHRYRKDPNIDIVLSLARKGLQEITPGFGAIGKRRVTFVRIFGKRG